MSLDTVHRDGAAQSADFSVDYARALDRADPLAPLRHRFYPLPSGRIYMDGNSLGLMSRDAEQEVLAALEAWRTHAIDGWTEGERPWFYQGETLGQVQAALVGAKPDEVVVTGAITVNLHALLATFYRPTAQRTKIVATALDFPSDAYALQAWLRLRGLDPAEHLVLVPSRDGRWVEEDDVVAALDAPDVALAWLPSVLYRSGQLLDVAGLTREAHARGLLIGFDCAHSVGALPHRLHDDDVDFAVWCSYKHLNGGPGAVGALFVHERHFGTLPGLAGWWGSDKERQFDMALEFTPAHGAGAWQISTPSILASAPLYGSLKIFAEAGIERIRDKSLRQTTYMMDLADALLAPLGFSVGTPREERRRGGHVALEHDDAVRIARALKARGIIPDFRAPNVVRLAPIALYTTYEEVWRTVEVLRQVVASGEHLPFSGTRGAVA